MKKLIKLINKLIGPTYVIIPACPPSGLLYSMALRDDHAFGMSDGMTDDKIIELRKNSPICGNQYLTMAEKQNRLNSMRQLHEEVVGKGFYTYE
jgi:hypothetical protein